MPAYLITGIETTDRKGHDAYRARVGDLLENAGKTFIACSGEIEVLEGDWQPRRKVMCVADRMDKARQWKNSSGDRELKRLRQNTAAMNVLRVEGA